VDGVACPRPAPLLHFSSRNSPSIFGDASSMASRLWHVLQSCVIFRPPGGGMLIVMTQETARKIVVPQIVGIRSHDAEASPDGRVDLIFYSVGARLIGSLVSASVYG